MKKKIINILMKIIFSIVLLLTISVFVISNIESGTAMAISKKGGAFFVNSFSKLEIGSGTIISKNTATGGGGVYVEGDVVTFGSYPKTFIVSDSEDKKLKKSNESSISETKDENGYYIGTDGKSRYAKVSANPSSSSYVFNDGTTIVSGTEYYFKVEPIKWRVLKIENGKALLLCEDVIDAHWFYGLGENRTINNETIYANNYKYSDIRAWLNGYKQETGNTNGENWENNGFLQKAFTSEERNLILETTIDNSASTSESETNQYFCDNTNDKIFLIDYQDLINTKNGFNSDYSNKDVMRMKKTTDFSKANGTFSSDVSGYSGNCFWWTRSSSLTKSYWVDVVCADGVSKYDSHVSVSARGVVPALWVSESMLNTGIGTLVLSGGTIADNTAISGNGHDVYNNGTFTMTGGTVGTSGNSQTGYGIYNTGTMCLYGGIIHDSIYSSTSFITRTSATINGTITLEDSAIITVEDYAGTTPEYNIIVSISRSAGTILKLKGSSTIPDLDKISITGFNSDTYSLVVLKGDSDDEWLIEIQIQFPSTWKTEIASTTYMSTTLTPTDLTSIIFDKTVPSGYSQTPIGFLSTGLGVYLNSSDSSKIAFVGEGKILAPNNSSSLFDSLKKLKTITFNNFITANVYEASKMFNECSALTSLDLSCFDTNNIQYMSSMFYNCSSLTSLNVSSFNMTKVLRTASMFEGCSALTTLDILNFNKNNSSTENVVITAYMFKNCSKLSSLDLTGFKTNSVTEMQQMFYGCSSLKKMNVSSFNTSKVTDMTSIFSQCNEITEISGLSSFDTSNVKNMRNMFYYDKKLVSVDVSSFNTSNVTNMAAMFEGCYVISNLDISNFNTSKVESMDWMFKNCLALSSLNLSTFDTNLVNNMQQMFSGCSSLKTLTMSTSFNTSKVTSMNKMFNGCSALSSLDLSTFNMTNVKDYTDMLNFGSTNKITELKTPFNNPATLSIVTGSTLYNKEDGNVVSNVPSKTSKSLTYVNDLSLILINFPTSWKTEVASTTYMSTIITPTNLTSIIFDKTVPSGYSEIGKLSTGLKVYRSSSDSTKIAFITNAKIYALNGLDLFSGLSSLTSLTFSNFDTSKVTSMGSMFSGCSSLLSLDLSGFNTSNVTLMSSMFYNCLSLTSLNVSSFNMTKVLRMASMFEGCSALTTLDILNFNKNNSSTENVVITAYMFKKCSKLSSLDLTGFKTNSVTEIQQMFYGCSSLTNLDLSVLNKNGSNTSKVSQMQQMFEGCNGLKSVNLTGFDTSSTTLMYRMFYDCSKLSSLDISSFNTSKVTNMGNMFKGCLSLTSLGVDGFDTSNVAYFDNMFYGCSGLTSLDVSNFNTAKAVNMSHMFAGCEKLTTINVSSFDTSNVTNMSYMFNGCYVVTTLDISEFNTSKVTDMSWMFGNCYAVTELDISGFDTAKVTNMSGMFSCCYVVKSLNFSSFNTSNVTDMSRMFYFCKGLTTDHTNMEKLDLSTFDTQKVTTMTYMFASCQQITAIDLSSFDTSNVTNMSYMFNGCSKLRTPTKKSGDLKTALSLEASSGLTFGVGFTVKNVSNMECMFRNCSTLKEIEKTSNEIVFEIGEKATNMSKMFEGCSSLTSVNFSSSSNTSNVTNMSYMFNGCSKLTTIDLSYFDTSNVTNMTSMFNGCSSITILYIPFNMAKVTAYGNMLNLGETNQIVEIKTPFTSKTNGEFLLTITTGVEVFYNEDGSEIDVDYHEGFYITSTSEFYKSSKTVELDATCVDQIVSLFRVLKNSISGIRFEKTAPDGYTYKGTTENGIYVYYSGNNYAFVSGDVIFAPEDCSEMFKDLICCESIIFNNFKFSKITNVSKMFYNCPSIIELNLSSFDMSGVVEYSDMFYNCSSLATLKTPYNVFVTISLGKIMYKGSIGYSSLPQDLSSSVTLTKTATSSFSSKTKQTNQIQETSLDIICEDRRKFILDLSVDNENKIA